MRLTAFRVTNFRSVRDSGWISADNVTALIGTNESGKTNLLMPLWKLKPAKEGEIHLLADAPRKDYIRYRSMKDKPCFITARFELSEKLAEDVAAKSGVDAKTVQIVEVSRDFDGRYGVHFPGFDPLQLAAKKADLATAFKQAATEIEALTPSGKADETLKQEVLAKLTRASEAIQALPDDINEDALTSLQAVITPIPADGAPAKSTVAPRYTQVVDLLAVHTARLSKGGPEQSSAVLKLITDSLPVFVYYSTYGNLDSEIYLPHVIQDLTRKDIGGKTEARARTLRVLFDFVKLKAEEILELGKGWNEQAGRPSEAQIQALAEKKKQRSVLLQSASSDLTSRFRAWWKQGNYRFRFEADGDHFRIWVSDDQRPEEIELEGRSTGLQWFLSFYLVFLVESTGAHNGAILLLDEPGLSLHPLAQRDLSVFFDNLAASNQLLYTTHSPFLVDADHLDRVRNVYVDEKGYTVASPDLRAGQAAAQTKSAYAVHASLGLSVSETLFQGCRPIVVEGQSDQLYLSAIKTVLIGGGWVKSSRELLFVPACGVKAIKAIAAILGGRNDELPAVLCDGDQAGKALAKTLKAEMYVGIADRVLLASEFVKIPEAETEDIFPRPLIVPILDRYLKGPVDQPFSPVPDAAIVPQVKAYAAKHGIELSQGWKVEVARLVKARIAAIASTDADVAAARESWAKLFARFAPETTSPAGLPPMPPAAAVRSN